MPAATDTSRVNILNKLTGLYISSNLHKSDSLAKIVSGMLDVIDYQTGRIENYNHLAYINGSLGKFDDALDFSEKAIQLSKSSSNKEWLAKSYDYRFVLLFQKGEYGEAQKYTDSCIAIAEKESFTFLLAKSYDNQGILLGLKGRHSEAVEYFMKSLEVSEEIGDDNRISTALMHLGHTFELAGNYQKAMEYLKRSLKIHQTTENKFNEAWALVNIGVTYSRLNELDTALTYYQTALELAEQINDRRLILTCLDNIGGKYSLKGEFEKANYYLGKAYRLSEQSGQNSRTVYITGNLAENFLYMGQYDSARLFGEKQLELAKASELISEQKVAYYILAQIYDSLGDYKRAHESLLGYIAVNDTIFNQQKSEQIESLREAFETEKKEQEILLLAGEKRNVEFRRNLYGIIALLVFVIGVIFYNRQRLRTRKNRQLLEKEIELDRMKSRFFANISHEFRTPLTLILGPIDDLISKIDQAEIKKQLKIMQRNASRLLDLVNQLLDLSKIESGNLKLSISTSDIVSVIKGVTMSFHSLAKQKNISLKLDIPHDQLELNYDKAKFETILTNLLSNAFKFTPELGRITVETEVIKKNGRHQDREFLKIKVSDTGEGIPEEDLHLIFDRFYQSDNNQLHQQEGSGIGLALTRELVELHDGIIAAESKLGEGTQIIVELPMDKVPDKAKQMDVGEYATRQGSNDEEVLPVTREYVEKAHHDLPVVLVVEDHQDVSNYIQEILNKQYSVVSAADGEEGIAKAMEIIPDLIISDVMMPKKNGYEVCGILKQDEKTSHIPVILLTAKSDSEDKITGLMTRADDYVTKPFVPRELLARIDNLIESRNKLREKYKMEGVLRPGEVTVNSIDEKFLNKLIELVEQHMGNDKFGVEQLAEEIGMSRSHLHRKLTALIDQGPNEFIRNFRLQRAHDLIRQNSASTAEIAYQVGFSSPSYFTKCFHEKYGYTPSEIHQKTTGK